MSELALELVRRQRAAGLEILLTYPLHNLDATTPWSRHGGIPADLWNSGWTRLQTPLRRTARFWLAATTTVLAGRLNEKVQQEATVSQALRFLVLKPRRKMGGRGEEFFLCVHVASRTSETHPEPGGNITRQHQVGSKRPSSSDTRYQDGLETSSRESWTSHQ